MAEKALYVLAGYDDRTEEILSGIQKSLYEQGFSGVQTKDIPMHFTLGSWPVDREKELKERLRQAAASHPAFGVAFSHVGLFRLPQNDVLFIAPETGREMLDLKDEFMDSMDPFSWSPHTTMLIDRPEVVREALASVLDTFPAVSGKVEKLYLYEFWPARHILSVQLRPDARG